MTENQARRFVCISLRLLGALFASATSAQSNFDTYTEAKWLEDGWRVGFTEAHCYIGNSYVDRGNDAIEIVNINFVQIANLRLAKSEYYFDLWGALDQIGVKQDELIFLIATPGLLDWRGDKRTIYPIKVMADGLETAQVDTTDFLDDSGEQGWFIVREPQSSQLIEKFSGAMPIRFDVVFNDDSQLSFEYNFKPDLDFKVKRAQFEACLRVLASNAEEE